jgi:predicted dehydrogenase
MRLALAGSGAAATVHGLAATAAGVPVVAVASRDRQRAAERAGQLGARPCRYDELPAGATAVVVATPPPTHAELALAAVRDGAAVLVETPLCTTLADADRLVAASNEDGAVVVYGESLAAAPLVGQAVRLTRGLGPLRFVEARALSPRPEWGDHLQPSWGGGALFDLGVHPLALALLLAADDEPVELAADLAAPDRQALDDHARVELRFASGLRAVVEASWRTPEVVWDLQASSDTGVVRADLLPRPGLERDGDPVAAPDPEPGVDPLVAGLGFVEQLRALRAACGGRAPALDATFGRRVLDLVCAAYASAGSGGPVPLPFTGRRDRTPLELWRG